MKHGDLQHMSVTVGVISELRVTAVALTQRRGILSVEKYAAGMPFAPPRRRWLVSCSALEVQTVRDSAEAAVVFGLGYSCEVLDYLALAVGMEMQERLEAKKLRSIVQVQAVDLLYGKGFRMECSALVVKLALAEGEDDDMVEIRLALGVRAGEVSDLRIAGFHAMPMAESILRCQAMREPLKQDHLRPYKDFAVQIVNPRDDPLTLVKAIASECSRAGFAGRLAYAVFELWMGTYKLRIGFNAEVLGMTMSPEFVRRFHTPTLMGKDGFLERYLDWRHAARWYQEKGPHRGGLSPFLPAIA
jgi:hypothetical protein